jgi:hypothetical protein
LKEVDLGGIQVQESSSWSVPEEFNFMGIQAGRSRWNSTSREFKLVGPGGIQLQESSSWSGRRKATQESSSWSVPEEFNFKRVQVGQSRRNSSSREFKLVGPGGIQLQEFKLVDPGGIQVHESSSWSVPEELNFKFEAVEEVISSDCNLLWLEEEQMNATATCLQLTPSRARGSTRQYLAQSMIAGYYSFLSPLLPVVHCRWQPLL